MALCCSAGDFLSRWRRNNPVNLPASIEKLIDFVRLGNATRTACWSITRSRLRRLQKCNWKLGYAKSKQPTPRVPQIHGQGPGAVFGSGAV